MKGTRKNIFNARTLSNLVVICMGVFLYLFLSNFLAIWGHVQNFGKIISPFVSGLAIAYLLNIPVKFFETKIFKNMQKKHGISVLISYALAILLIMLLVGLVLPQVIESISTLTSNVPIYINNLNNFITWLTTHFQLNPESLSLFIESFQALLREIPQKVLNYIPNLLGLTVRLGSGLISGLTAVIASIYMLLARDKLVAQSKKVMFALLPKRHVSEVIRVSRLCNGVFSGFIGGKIIDSAIIGAICFVFMSIMNAFFIKMPFALLISIIIGITNIIPFFGPFIGAVPSSIILLLVDPVSALAFIIFIIFLQQFDGNYLGPKILGNSTGLPALWVLVAIIIGGGLFGFPGMVLGVPTSAVLYTLTSDFIAKKLKKKNMSASGNSLNYEEISQEVIEANPPI